MKDDLKTEVVNPKIDEEKNKSSNSNNSNKRVGDIFRKLLQNKMMKYMVMLVGFLVIFLLVMFIVSVLFPGKPSYAKVEATMENAARAYFHDRSDKLPQEELSSVSISAERLAELKYMKTLDKYFKDDTECSGNVTVTKNSADTYNYVGYLDCGKDYVTKEFYKEIIASKNIVNNGYGIYNINNEFVYKGEIKNNYVMVDKLLFRIVKVNSNNEVVLILNEPTTVREVWDDRFNKSQDWESGINDYAVSRARDYLKNMYNVGDDETIKLSANTKEKLVKFNACIGKRKEDETAKDNSVECSRMLSNQIISLLTAADYMNASADVNCRKTLDKSCKNYNYLADDENWWLLTADAKNDFEVYQVDNGIIDIFKASQTAKFKPIIHLGPTTKYDSGKGTEKDPYVFR